MLNVMSTQNLQDFMAAVFRNFREAEDRLNEVAAPPTVLDENGDPITPPGGGGSPTNMFDVIYLSNTNTKIYKNAGGDLVFEDVNSGPVTLAEIVRLIGYFWESGLAHGVTAANAAGTVKYFGNNETADGWNVYDAPENVE